MPGKKLIQTDNHWLSRTKICHICRTALVDKFGTYYGVSKMQKYQQVWKKVKIEIWDRS